MISIRIIRCPSTPASDDRILIQKQNDHTCVVTFIDATSLSRSGNHLVMHPRDVPYYLYRVFDLLGMDTDPFHNVQLDANGFPSTVFAIPLSEKNKRMIVSVVKDLIYSYDQA